MKHSFRRESRIATSLSYKQKVYRFIRITKVNILSSGGISYKDAVEKQHQIEASIKTYEDYVIEKYKKGFMSHKEAFDIISEYLYNKYYSQYSYKLPSNIDIDNNDD